ncbi:MAG TPA: Holliday junction resolvase RuvX [Solirubrobacteraceae bacterium]|nr:Holliday junction resolvase RuvX [Solirubrobacteraceae bacterium]
MRVLALDYGSARCGCALSDPTGTIVTPIEPVLQPATRRGLGLLAALVSEREVQRVVVGLPLSLRGSDTAQTRETRAFAQRLATRLGAQVPVELHDERFTTRMAQRSAGTASSEDSRAAAHLLESWLVTRSR